MVNSDGKTVVVRQECSHVQIYQGWVMVARERDLLPWPTTEE